MIKKAFRKIVSWTGLAPYHLTLKLTRLSIKFCHRDLEIWARNSYSFNTIQPGYSDLDLTVYIPKSLGPASAKNFLDFTRFVRLLWPLLGEINVYHEEHLKEALLMMNAFELSRDPQLIRKLKSVEPFDSAQAAVFLFRHLEKDIFNLHSHPAYRQKKWDGHFQQIDRLLPELELLKFCTLAPEKSIESIIAAIVFLCGQKNPSFRENLNESLTLYFEMILKKVDFSKLRQIFLKDSWLFVFSAHRTTHLETTPFMLSQMQQRILALQIKWELWGLETQSMQSKDDANLMDHKLHLLQNLKKQNSYQWSSEFQGLVSLD